MKIIALTGAGADIAGQHVEAIKRHKDFSLGAVADLDANLLEAKFPELGDNNRFTQQSAMLEALGETLDAVSLTVPNFLHKTLSIEALQAGQNVLCEKPAADSLEEAVSMREIASETGKLLVIAYHNLHAPEVQEYLAMRESGQFGTLGEFDYKCSGCFPAQDRRNWFMSTGPLKDMGSNALSVILPAIQKNKKTAFSNMDFHITNSLLERVDTSDTDVDVPDRATVVLSIDGVKGQLCTDWRDRGSFVSQTKLVHTDGSQIILDHASHQITLGSEVIFDVDTETDSNGAYRDYKSYVSVYTDFLSRMELHDSNSSSFSERASNLDLALLNMQIIEVASQSSVV